MSILRRFSVNFLSLTISYLSTLFLSLFTNTYLSSSYLSVSLYFEKSVSVGMECVLASSFICSSKCTSIYSSIMYFLFFFDTFSISFNISLTHRNVKDQSALKMTLNQLLVEMDGFEQNKGIDRKSVV